MSGSANKVQAYWKFATATMPTMPAVSCAQRLFRKARRPVCPMRGGSGGESLLGRRFLQLQQRAAAVAIHLFEALDLADVAPVINVVQLALHQAMDLNDLQEAGVADQPAGQPHGPLEQR